MKKYVEIIPYFPVLPLLKLLCSPEVEFCGYSIPHPSEAKMNVRIQTYGIYHLESMLLNRTCSNAVAL